MSRIRRRIVRRMLIWQPQSGTIIDIPSRYVLQMEGPTKTEEYVEITDGTKRPVRRSSRVQVPLIEREAAIMSEVFRRQNRTVKAAFLGLSKTDHWLWLEPTRANITDPSVGSGSFADKVLDLESSIFYPAIWEGMDLIDGVPWQGTGAKSIDNNIRRGIFLTHPGKGERPGYRGPLWSAGQDVVVDILGEASNLNNITTASITIEFPVWGAVVKLEPVEGGSLTNPKLVAKTIGGTILATANNAPLELPQETWTVTASVDGATSRPRLRLVDAGRSADVIKKINIPPEWDLRLALIYEKNIPLYWNLRGDAVYDPNLAPEWFDLPNLIYNINLQPNWDNRDNVEYNLNTPLYWNNKGSVTFAPNIPPEFDQRGSVSWETIVNNAPTFDQRGSVSWEAIVNNAPTFDQRGSVNWEFTNEAPVWDNIQSVQWVKNTPLYWENRGIVKKDPSGPPTWDNRGSVTVSN